MDLVDTVRGIIADKPKINDGELVGRVDGFFYEPNDDGKEGTGFFPARIDAVRFWGKAMNQDDAMRIMTLAVDPLDKLSVTSGDVILGPNY